MIKRMTVRQLKEAIMEGGFTDLQTLIAEIQKKIDDIENDIEELEMITDDMGFGTGEFSAEFGDIEMYIERLHEMLEHLAREYDKIGPAAAESM